MSLAHAKFLIICPNGVLFFSKNLSGQQMLCVSNETNPIPIVIANSYTWTHILYGVGLGKTLSEVHQMSTTNIWLKLRKSQFQNKSVFP